MVYLSICLYPLWFLSSVSYSFLHTGLFVSLGRFMPMYFILYVAMVNGIVSLISHYNFLLLVYRNESYFCILILYPSPLLYSLISSSNFLAATLVFSMYRIMQSANSECFTSFFSLDSFYLFFFFDCCVKIFQNYVE